jgi:hypothetical protein
MLDHGRTIACTGHVTGPGGAGRSLKRNVEGACMEWVVLVFKRD